MDAMLFMSATDEEDSCLCSFVVQIEAGLSALEEALKAGYEDFKVTNQLFCSIKHMIDCY